ncbi:putative mitochondrial hypothetical protein [Leptomonas pyrrhocoris]|uniref:SET domain-containing protein n=1 Tax=Leptomonas pyrrhocoris TaxID=157538 RepID=A0A0M9FZ81_LEPPY|nr:putative mitochondrial hypothetical protein [Leptomonas pyrrhocoris]KPA78947.1 putative mitochondrial hypothetical protein [Leptomonas pyrrhocoris]|eukprot:XP_015657386.1 putative mitochondrial hypothetical protein [Leptomonas pyrrhocoris]
MRKLTSKTRPGWVAAQMRHCSSSEKSSSRSGTTASSSTAPHPSPSSSKTTDAATFQKAPLHPVHAENDDIANRVAAGRSPHLNTAYQSKWRRTAAASTTTDGGPHRSPRQRVRQTQSSKRRATTFADDTGAGASAADNRSSTATTNLPMVHPGAELPPLPQGRLTEKRVGKFSFVSDPSERASRDFYGHEVPNNTPKARLPMWASSLTAPSLGKVRLVPETWTSQDARGTIDAVTTAKFVAWLTDTVLPAGAALREQLNTSVLLDLRRATARGVYARRTFSKGEVVLTIPVSTASSAPTSAAAATALGQTSWNTPWLTLNSEVLAAHSTGARRRPGLPDYEAIKQVLSVRRSSFDPIPHPMFIDQVHAALLLACEKADGPSSPLHPYIQLLPAEELFDDERIKELHLGVLDPPTHMEYTEHRSRFQHYLRELHKAWWKSYENAVTALQGQTQQVSEGAATSPTSAASSLGYNATLPLTSSKVVIVGAERTAAVTAADVSTRPTDIPEHRTAVDVIPNTSLPSLLPPPSLEDVEWAFRVVLSRQKMLPHLRVDRQAFERVQQESAEGDELDGFGRALMKCKYALYQHVLRAVDADRLHVNEVDPSSIPTVVPLLDMLSHPPSGVGNVRYSVEEVQRQPVKEGGTRNDGAFDKATSSTAAVDDDSHPCRTFQVVVRAAENIDEDEELTVAYTKCYSVAYTLYRYGFLPLSRREDDTAALLMANGMDGRLQPTRRALRATAAPLTQKWWASLISR